MRKFHGFLRKVVLWFTKQPRETDMTDKVFQVAKAICKACNYEVSNLKLQKIAYILQMLSYGSKDKKLFESEFEAWDYGPVIPKLYRAYKCFGSEDLEDYVFEDITDIECETENKFIAHNARVLNKLSGGRLISLTHEPGSGWSKRYTPGVMGIKIQDKDMKEEYEGNWQDKRHKTS